jgi:hypothetical protein
MSISSNDVKEPPPAPPGARQWLAEMLRYAIADAQRAMPNNPSFKRGARGYVLGHLLGASELSHEEQFALLDATLSL